MTLTDIAKMTEDDARDYLEQLRWPNGPVCPHCESDNVTRMHGEKHRAGTIQCNGWRSHRIEPRPAREMGSRVPLALLKQERHVGFATPTRIESRLVPNRVVHGSPDSSRDGRPERSDTTFRSVE